MGGFHLFTLGGIPVHFTLWYFLILLYWARGGMQSVLTWGAVITVSILVHEFGHALVARYFRLSPWVELHGWGGLCHHDRAARDRDDALIIAAGPGAGLLLGGLVFVGSRFIDPMWLKENFLVAEIISNLLYVNLGWSLVNLAPLWPLDGGQLFRLGMLKLTRPAQAERVTHVVGIIVGATFCYLAFTFFGGGFMLLIAAFLTWQNVQRVNATSATGPIRTQGRLARQHLADARRAYEARDWQEALRLAHQVKAEAGADAGVLEDVFEILGVGTAALGHYEEAWSYLCKVPRPKGNVYLAQVECVLGLNIRSAAPALVRHAEFARLPADVQRDLQALAGQ
jgi:stage IV sporulation protein FB